MQIRHRLNSRPDHLKASITALLGVMLCALTVLAQQPEKQVQKNPFVTATDTKIVNNKGVYVLGQAIALQESETRPSFDEILNAADADLIDRAIATQETPPLSAISEMLNAADADRFHQAIKVQESTAAPSFDMILKAAESDFLTQAIVAQSKDSGTATTPPNKHPEPNTPKSITPSPTATAPNATAPIASAPIATKPIATNTSTTAPITPPSTRSMQWWNAPASGVILGRPQWVTFDLETVLVDTLRQSPRIRSLTHRASMAMERIVQQDAAFDPTTLLGGKMGRTNDPVGNTLTTGGASRLQEQSGNMRAGIQRNGRRGTEFGLSQELGLLDSNSTFFSPNDQGNARLSLSLTQPLLARGGQVYNERLLMRARLDSRITWQEMRGDVESRVGEVIGAYWGLYETRCHLLQQRELLERGVRIEKLIEARSGFDSGRVELAKARQRVARRQDQLVVFDAEVKKQQTRLATLIGSPQLCGAESRLELIPAQIPVFPDLHLNIQDVMIQAVENRPDIKAAASQLEVAGLAVRVTRTEMVPQLKAVVNASLAALNGNNDIAQSFVDQFNGVTPALSGGLQYEMPRGRRAARSRHREAQHQYRQRSEELREAIQQTQWETESALIDVKRALAQQQSKNKLLQTALDEEKILQRRWELIGGDGSRVGVVLENLLDAQQRRTDAERELVSAQTDYMTSLGDLQTAMGTLLKHEGIDPVRNHNSVNFVRAHAPKTESIVDGQVISQQPALDQPSLSAPIMNDPAVAIQNSQIPSASTSPNQIQQERNALAIPIPFLKR